MFGDGSPMDADIPTIVSQRRAPHRRNYKSDGERKLVVSSRYGWILPCLVQCAARLRAPPTMPTDNCHQDMLPCPCELRRYSLRNGVVVVPATLEAAPPNVLPHNARSLRDLRALGLPPEYDAQIK